MSAEMVSLGEEGEGHFTQMDQKQKGTGTNSGVETGARNLEAKIIRSRAESMGGCVKLKTVTEIRQSSSHETITAESIYLVLNCSLDWEPVERLKQWNDVSFMFFQYEASSTVVTKAVDRGIGQNRKERTAVVAV